MNQQVVSLNTISSEEKDLLKKLQINRLVNNFVSLTGEVALSLSTLLTGGYLALLRINPALLDAQIQVTKPIYDFIHPALLDFFIDRLNTAPLAFGLGAISMEIARRGTNALIDSRIKPLEEKAGYTNSEFVGSNIVAVGNLPQNDDNLYRF